MSHVTRKVLKDNDTIKLRGITYILDWTENF